MEIVAFKVPMDSVKGRDISGCYTINGFAQAFQVWVYTALPELGATFGNPLPNNPSPPILAYKGRKGRRQFKEAILSQKNVSLSSPMFLYLKKESLHLRSISLRLSSSPTVFLPGSSSPRRIDGLLFLSTMHQRSEKWEIAGKKTDRDGAVEKASITTVAVTLVTTTAVMLEQPDRGGCRVGVVKTDDRSKKTIHFGRIESFKPLLPVRVKVICKGKIEVGSRFQKTELIVGDETVSCVPARVHLISSSPKAFLILDDIRAARGPDCNSSRSPISRSQPQHRLRPDRKQPASVRSSSRPFQLASVPARVRSSFH
ncbi:hypothetical protein F2Q68_00006118 [Brassica cretica]|uniref:Uncharacterized protein n=1 Tax=Brassica cretica TaxID=69181 RepID=A0A8S9J677_BRACR|nr:hypothetical protein F2Q68_00006118 [Brassica cretica]